MKLRDLYLTEGIIKVPPTLLKQINLYVSSVYATRIADSIEMVNQVGYMRITGKRLFDQEREDAKQKLVPELTKILKYLQTNYGAKILSNDSFKKVLNSSIKLNIPVQELMSELPNNLRKPEVQKNLENLTTRLRMSYKTDDRFYGGLSHQRSHDDHIIQITIYDIGDTPQSALHVIRSSMSTVYHESQHYIQSEVIDFVDKSKRQTQYKDGYENVYDVNNPDRDAYHSSSVEYTPQIGDLGHLAINKLQDMKDSGELTGNMNKDITAAVQHALSSSHRTKILKALKKYGEIDRHNKGLKIIYSMVAKKYDSVLNSEDDNDHSDIDTSNREELENNEDILDTIYNMIDDSKFKVLQSFYTVQQDKEMKFKFKDGSDPYVNTIKFNDDGTYMLSLHQAQKEKYSISFDDSKKFIQICSELLHSKDVEQMLEIYDWLDYDSKPEVSTESIEQMLSELQKQYGGEVEGTNITLPNADDGMDVNVQFRTDYNSSKEGIMKISFSNEIGELGLNDMKDLASLILQSIPKGVDAVYDILTKYKTKDEIIKGLEELKNKNAVDDSDIERVLSKAKHDTEEVYQHQGEAKIYPERLKISFKFPDFVRFQPGTKDKYSVEMVYKGNWRTIPMDDLYDVVYYIVMTYDQEKEYITKLLSSSEYSDEQFIKRIKEAHMGEDNYFEW